VILQHDNARPHVDEEYYLFVGLGSFSSCGLFTGPSPFRLASILIAATKPG
ncbi:hypothetical protein X777_00744, partial [Ooceraea biroi]